MIPPHVEIELILDTQQLLVQRLCNRLEQLAPRTDEAPRAQLLFREVGEAVRQVGRTTYRQHHGVGRIGTGDVIQEALQQFDGEIIGNGFLALLDHPLEHPIELPVEQLDIRGRLHAAFGDRHQQGLGGIQQTPQPRGSGGRRDPIDQATQYLEATRHVEIAQPLEQGAVVIHAQPCHQFGHSRIATAGFHGLGRQLGVQARREQRGLGHQRRIARRPQIVHQGQQDQRDVGLTRFNAVEVGR